MDVLAANDPQQIGAYRLHSRLGVGGMGRVFLGFSPAGRAVAVKVVHPEFARDTEFVRRFTHEVGAAQAVSGAYTAPVVASGCDDDPPWLATAFVAAPTLAQVVAEAGALPEEAVWRLAGGLIEALQAVHACGLVHRDLKPANVLIAADGPRVIDFGISKALEGTALTASRVIVGTPAYMSPEQAEGRPVEPPSDVFALGSLITFAASGISPFAHGESVTTTYRIVHCGPNLTGVPDSLHKLVADCLAKDPARRPSLAQLMDRVVAGSAAYPVASATDFWPASVTELVNAEQENLRLQGSTTAVPGPRTAEPELRHEPTASRVQASEAAESGAVAGVTAADAEITHTAVTVHRVPIGEQQTGSVDSTAGDAAGTSPVPVRRHLGWTRKVAIIVALTAGAAAVGVPGALALRTGLRAQVHTPSSIRSPQLPATSQKRLARHAAATPSPSLDRTRFASATATASVAPPVASSPSPVSPSPSTAAPALVTMACTTPAITCSSSGGTPYMHVEPGKIYGSGDGAVILTNIAWSSWGQATATGSGTLEQDNCHPSCANGTYKPFPGTVIMSGLTSYGADAEAYSRMVISAPTAPYGSMTFQTGLVP